MAILERPASLTVEIVPAFQRLDPVQDGLTIDERDVTPRAVQGWGRGVRRGRKGRASVAHRMSPQGGVYSIDELAANHVHD
jgi:hypothetical protein